MLERENVYDSIRDLEYDFEMGKIERADYERFHRELRADALAIFCNARGPPPPPGRQQPAHPRVTRPRAKCAPAACRHLWPLRLAPRPRGSAANAASAVASAQPDSNEAPGRTCPTAHAGAGPAGREVGTRVTEPLLTVRGLEKRFGALTALRGVDLELPARQRAIAVIGPNGAGKSTLLRILAGLAHPTGGGVTLAGGHSPRAAVGYLGHATLLYPELTARENLIFAGRLQRVDNPAARADVLLEEEGLVEARDRRAGTLSRGMSQRLSIARARVHDPELLLLDEPYTGLDRRSADRLTARLHGLRAAGHSLVLVTHDLHQAALLADVAVVLVRGQIVHRATGEALRPEPLEAAYAAALAGAA